MTRRRHATRSRVALTASLIGAGLIATSLAFLGNRDDQNPGSLVHRVEEAVRAARVDGALARAPLTLSLAEEAYAQGLLEQRREELRLEVLRDYARSKATLELALAHAETARALARRGQSRDRTLARQSVSNAEAGVQDVVTAAARVWLAEPARHRLQRSRALSSQARTLLESGGFGEAAARAGEAVLEAAAVESALYQATARFTDLDRIRTWTGWVDETIAWSKRTGQSAVIVDKDAHTLLVYQRGQVVRRLGVELGWNNVDDKRQRGDGATPEGRYRITDMKGRGRSRYHKALLIDYPNRADLKRLADLKAAGAVSKGTEPGGLIEIHGEGGRGRDWTDGCVAITNDEIDWLFARVAVGTPVVIVGSTSGSGIFSHVARRTTP